VAIQGRVEKIRYIGIDTPETNHPTKGLESREINHADGIARFPPRTLSTSNPSATFVVRMTDLREDRRGSSG